MLTNHTPIIIYMIIYSWIKTMQSREHHIIIDTHENNLENISAAVTVMCNIITAVLKVPK
jgi:hypothetical protein